MPAAPCPDRTVVARALSALAAGQLAVARQLVVGGLETADDPLARAELLRLRARLGMWSGPIALDDWVELVTAAETTPSPGLAAQMLCDAAVLAAYTRQLPQAELLAERALALTGGQGPVGALAAVDLGIAYGLTGRAEQAAPLLERAGELLDHDGGIVEAAELLQHVVLARMVQERYDAAMDAASAFLTAARPLGAVGLLPLPLCLLAHAGWKAGAWERVRLAAAEALTLAQGTGEPALELYASAMLALVAGGQGRTASCRERVAATLELSDETGIGMFRVTANMALVHLALGLGRPEEALEPLAQVTTILGGARRSGMLNWHADHVDVLVQLGEPADEVLARLEDDAATSAWERAALLRCEGQAHDDVEALRRSVAAFDFQPYEQARSRLRLAQRLVGTAEGREQAALADVAFGRLRAAGWQAQAAAVLEVEVGAVEARAVDAGAQVPRRRATDLPPVPAGTLELRLLGGFCVLLDGRELALPPGTGAQALKHVALHGGRSESDQLVEALWPGAEPGRGRTRLRNVLNRLRPHGELLVRDGEGLVLPPGTVVDVDVFLAESGAGLAGAERAVARYSGELLPGDRFHDWTSGPRERLRGRYLQLLDRLAADATARGDVDAAVTWHERAIEEEQYDEDRYVALAALLAAHGRTGPAHRVVRRALAVLDRIGVEPSCALRELAGS